MAFAKFYWEESSRALHAGDVDVLKGLYEPGCDVCQTYVERVEGHIDKGLHSDVVATTITGSTATDQTDGKSDSAVTLKAKNAPYRLVDDSGNSIGRTKGMDYKVILYLDWKGGGWTVVDSFMIL